MGTSTGRSKPFLVNVRRLGAFPSPSTLGCTATRVRVTGEVFLGAPPARMLTNGVYVRAGNVVGAPFLHLDENAGPGRKLTRPASRQLCWRALFPIRTGCCGPMRLLS